MINQAFCVHGHFYQPPREDPLTGRIPQETGASPYRNWNERIHAECYRPNAEAGNFEHISFNVGPTLMAWMYGYDPLVYHKIITQEQANYKRYGVGNGMAQGYHHTILPLALHRDKVTQIRWGVADFQHRFGHPPAGFWLPETAVDMDSLNILEQNGIQYTILAPWQAARPVNSFEPYLVRLPNNRKITVFFYDQDGSTRISFDPGSTVNADQFMKNLVLQRFVSGHTHAVGPKLAILASDGELYGHHQPFRDKFLQHLVNGAMQGSEVQLTYPGRWLHDHPADHFIQIREDSSWSCLHGVNRWASECSCTPGSTWKEPLRRGLSKIGRQVDRLYQAALDSYPVDPWELRDEYIRVKLGEVQMEHFLESKVGRKLEEAEWKRLELLLSAQFERQRAFTSCGWFFEDFDRIEPRNNVAYMAQAAWLTSLASGVDLLPGALTALKPVQSVRSELRGDQVFLEKYHLAQVNAAENAYFKAASSLSI